jgi:tetratricopeptide (TPR) repeat protein
MFDPVSLLPPETGRTRPPTTTGLLDALRTLEMTATDLRDPAQPEALAHTLVRIGKIRLLLGETENLVETLQEAEMILGPSTEMHVDIGCALCYQGYYTRGKFRLEQAYKRNPTSEMLQGMFYAVLGAVYSRDQGKYVDAAAQLRASLAALMPEQIYIRTAVLIALADVAVAQSNGALAQDWLDQSDESIKKNKVFWYQPAFFAAKARLALLNGNAGEAIRYAQQGLGAVDERGDLRTLPTLYRMLAHGLESKPDRIDDARDARMRAVASARTRARRVELARALQEMGWHFQRFYRRSTQRARGAGFLFEAEQLYRDLGIQVPTAFFFVN